MSIPHKDFKNRSRQRQIFIGFGNKGIGKAYLSSAGSFYFKSKSTDLLGSGAVLVFAQLSDLLGAIAYRGKHGIRVLANFCALHGLACSRA